MEIIYDPKKNEKNIAKRDLSFDRAADFDFGTAVRSIDARKDYGEVRVVAIGYLDQRLHSLCYVNIDDAIREILVLMRSELRRHHVSLETELSAGLEPVLADC